MKFNISALLVLILCVVPQLSFADYNFHYYNYLYQIPPNSTTKGAKYTDGQILVGKTSDGSLIPTTLTAGSNVTITNGPGSITISATGGSGGGAPTTATYLTLTNDATLSAERLLTPGSGLTGTDGGANNAYTLSISSNGVSSSMLRQSSALSVIGNSTNATANVTDITGTDGQVLRVNGTTLGFGTIPNTSVTGLGTSSTHATTDFLQVSNNLSDISNTGTARNNLGLGTISTLADPLTETHGGTNQTTYTLGDTLYASGANALSKLAGNTSSTKEFYSQTGTGTVSAAPAWTTLSKSDVGLANVENTALSTWTGSTNLTTLGTITTGTWNGTAIDIAHGGTGQATANAALNALLPTQTGNAGKFLKTDGSNTSWATGGGATSPLTTKGDIWVYSTVDDRLPIGSNNYVLTVDTTQTADLSYVAVPWPNREAAYTFCDDFTSAVVSTILAGNMNWTYTASGTSAVGAASPATLNNRPGILRFTSGTTTTGRVAIDQGITNMFFGGGAVTQQFAFEVPTLPNSTDNFVLYLGMHDGNAAVAPTDGCYFLVDNSVTSAFTNIRGRCSKGGSNSDTTDTTYAAATWYDAKIVVNAGATSVSFYINGSQVGSAVTTNIPNTSSNTFAPSAFTARKTAGLTSTSMLDLDYVEFQQIFTSTR